MTADRNQQSSWRPPAPENLPGEDASLKEIIGFSRSFDPIPHFRGRWGGEFKANADALWDRCMEAYKAGAKPAIAPDELLLCLSKHLIAAPYLSLDENKQLQFLHWLINEVRQGLRIRS